MLHRTMMLHCTMLPRHAALQHNVMLQRSHCSAATMPHRSNVAAQRPGGRGGEGPAEEP